MRFDDIDCWARLLNEDEQAKNDELTAYAAAEEARAKRALKEYEELDQKQVDPKTLGLTEGGVADGYFPLFPAPSGGVETECDELDEKIDFSQYGVDCGDLLSEYDNDPLVSALDPLKSSTANLAAQDTVQYSIAEAVKDLTKAIRASSQEKCTLRKIGNGFALFAGDGRFLNGTGWCKTLDEACRMADECGAEIRNLDEFEDDLSGKNDLDEFEDDDMPLAENDSPYDMEFQTIKNVYEACKHLGVDAEPIANRKQFEEWCQEQNYENGYPKGRGVSANILNDRTDFKWDAISAAVQTQDSMLELLKANFRGESPSNRQIRKLCGCVLLQQLLVELGLD